jgi:hypothetical protein
VRGLFGVELSLRALFEEPSVARLAQRVEAARSDGAPVAAPPPLLPAPRDRELPLSFAQQRLWFLDRLEPARSIYNVFGALRLRGPLQADALALSLEQVVARHEALRTCFPDRDGQPRQRIAPAASVELPLVELSGIAAGDREQALRQLERSTAFNLDQTLHAWERGYIEAALRLTRGNVSQAAKLLGINRTTLYSRMGSGEGK